MINTRSHINHPIDSWWSNKVIALKYDLYEQSTCHSLDDNLMRGLIKDFEQLDQVFPKFLDES